MEKLEELSFEVDFREWWDLKRGNHNCLLVKNPNEDMKKTLKVFRDNNLAGCNMKVTIKRDDMDDSFKRRVKFISYIPELGLWKISWGYSDKFDIQNYSSGQIWYYSTIFMMVMVTIVMVGAQLL